MKKENLPQLVHKYLQGREFDKLYKLRKLGKKAVPILLFILQDQNAGYLRQRAAIALGKLRADEAIESLDEAANEDQLTLQVAVAKALGEIGGSKAEEILLRLLDNKDASLRKWIIRGLGKIGEPKSQKALRERLNIEPEMFLRREIRKILSTLE